jgi:hypothetical protein
MGGLYKVVVNGQWGTRDIKNTLYYRTAVDPFGGLFEMGGAPAIANLVKDNVVPAFLAAQTNGYFMDSIDVYPYNDLLQLAYQQPYHLPIAEPGEIALGLTGTDGAGVCVNIRFNLEPKLIGLGGITAPKRGYIALGPIPSTWVDNTGVIVDTIGSDAANRLGDLCDALATNLSSLAPVAVFFPIRASSKWGMSDLPGELLDWGWSDVSSAHWSKYCSYRKSRQVRG